MGKPLLAICFGTQILNVWRGGSLIQDLATAPPPPSPRPPSTTKPAATSSTPTPSKLPPDTILGRLVAESEPTAHRAPTNDCHPEQSEGPASPTTFVLKVNSSHHQAIANPGDGLRISARSPEDNVIEAVEGIPPTESAAPGSPAWNPFILGVQWHPERTFDHSATSRALFARLVTQAQAWTPRQPTTAAQTPQPHLVPADQTP